MARNTVSARKHQKSPARRSVRGGAGENAIAVISTAIPLGVRYLSTESNPKRYVPEPFIGPFVDAIFPSKELQRELNKAQGYTPLYYTDVQEKTREDTFWNKEKAGIVFKRDDLKLTSDRVFQDVDKTAMSIDKNLTDAAKTVYGSVQGAVTGAYPLLKSGVNASVNAASNVARTGYNILKNLSPQRRNPIYSRRGGYYSQI